MSLDQETLDLWALRDSMLALGEDAMHRRQYTLAQMYQVSAAHLATEVMVSMVQSDQFQFRDKADG